MKRVCFLVSVVLMFFSISIAGATVVTAPNQIPLDKNRNVSSVKPSGSNVIFTASATPGISSTSVDLGIPVSQHTCFVTTAGTAPTSVTVALYGSTNDATFAALGTVTYTVADPSSIMFHVVNKPVRYLKGYYVSKVGGDGTTTVVITCQSGGN